MGSSPGRGTKSLQAAIPQMPQKKKKPSRKNTPLAPAPPLTSLKKDPQLLGELPTAPSATHSARRSPGRVLIAVPHYRQFCFIHWHPLTRRIQFPTSNTTVPIQQNRKRRLREVNSFAQGHTARKQPSFILIPQISSPGPGSPRPRTPRAPSQSKQKGGGAG